MPAISFDHVRAVWRAADATRTGDNTVGILEAFAPPLTTAWVEDEIAAGEVADLYFIGGLPTDRYAQLTGGSHRVGDVPIEKISAADFAIDPRWRLILLRDPEGNRRVIIDGNGRALAIRKALAEGRLRPDAPISVIVGDIAQGIAFRAKAIAPLWR